jgi:hypothetical protein
MQWNFVGLLWSEGAANDVTSVACAKRDTGFTSNVIERETLDKNNSDDMRKNVKCIFSHNYHEHVFFGFSSCAADVA